MSETALTVAGDEGLAVATPPAEKYVHGFEGMAEGAFDEKAIAVLKEPVDPRLVEVKPDGIVYLPWTWYADRLNRAFGQGAWTIVPRDKAQIMGSHVIYFGALYVQKRFIREAAGECEYRANNPNMSYAACFEGAFSDCIVRCCKILGIGKELWDPTWREAWLAEWTLKGWAEKDGKNKPYYYRRDREKPYQIKGAVEPGRKPPPGAPKLPEVTQSPKAPALSVVTSPPSASGAVPSESAAPSTEPLERVPGSDDGDETADLVECWRKVEEGSRKAGTYKFEFVPMQPQPRRSDIQADRALALRSERGLNDEEWQKSLEATFNKSTTELLSREEADRLIEMLETAIKRWGSKKATAEARDQRKANRAAQVDPDMAALMNEESIPP